MRLITGDSIAVRHSIIRVRSIEAVVTMTDGILRHAPLIIACSVEPEEFPSTISW